MSGDSIVSASGSHLYQAYGVDMPPNDRWFCHLVIFFMFSSLLCSTYLLVAMTFERFYSIIRPHKAASFNTVQRARMIIVCVFVFFYSYGLPFLFITDVNNDARICIPNKYASDNTLGQIYHWLTDILTFIFPFLSLLTMNSVIIHTLRKRSKQALLESAGQDENNAQSLKSKQTEKQIITILLLVTFVFLFLNFPLRSLVYYLNFSSGDTPKYYAGLHLFFQIGDKSFYTNHGVNFFLYVMSGQKFRTDLKNLFIRKEQKRNKESTITMSSMSSTVN